MNWVFLDTIPWDYNVQSAFTRPLGGSQSALCYLAMALAERGHQVTTITGTTSPQRIRGVRCLGNSGVPALHPPEVFAPTDTVAVVLNFGNPDYADLLRRCLPRQAVMVLWTQHAAHEADMQRLRNPATAAAWDRIVCVSDWQRTAFCEQFPVGPDQIDVLRNAISPSFEDMFQDTSDLEQAKGDGLRLAYTSTPFRGLEVLVSCFPTIRRRYAQCELDVYSSMQVYFQDERQDQHQMVYSFCRITDGIHYHGSVPQPQLAQELRKTHVLAYPNTFSETSCIAVMEALAAGMLVVTSDLAALPETCNGWAKLTPTIVPERGVRQFQAEFTDALFGALAELQSDRMAFMRRRYEQVQAINARCTWRARAIEWESAARQWLQMRGASA